jgi:hypothetical protein
LNTEDHSKDQEKKANDLIPEGQGGLQYGGHDVFDKLARVADGETLPHSSHRSKSSPGGVFLWCGTCELPIKTVGSA